MCVLQGSQRERREKCLIWTWAQIRDPEEQGSNEELEEQEWNEEPDQHDSNEEPDQQESNEEPEDYESNDCGNWDMCQCGN